MSEPRFIQLHYLTPYHASLLNRDDLGLAKRIPFGGASRIRISSQCLKRHWRVYEGDYSLKSITEGSDNLDMSVRSRRIFENEIAKPLLSKGYNRSYLYKALNKLVNTVLGINLERKKETEKEEALAIETPQLVVLGRPEINYLKRLTEELISDASSVEEIEKRCREKIQKGELKKNLQALDKASGLDAALFGRMVTADILSRGDAAIHVAHAFSVHEEETETDFFTAVDDLVKAEGKLGSGHINETELTSNIYYGYVVVDLPQLVSNLEGVDRKDWAKADRTLSARIVHNLVHIIATVSPGAKLGSTAPYSRANTMLIESGSSQPRTLANAYIKPVNLEKGSDPLRESVDAMGRHLRKMDSVYGKNEERRVVSIQEIDDDFPAEKCDSINNLAVWILNQIEGGEQ